MPGHFLQLVEFNGECRKCYCTCDKIPINSQASKRWYTGQRIPSINPNQTNTLLKTYFLLLFCSFSICTLSSQTNFETGYYIDNSGKRTDGLIRNLDWRNNPEHFQFKHTAEAEAQTFGIARIQEFGIGDFIKYQRHIVMIDASSDLTSELTSQRVPTFTKKTLFLKVLVAGGAALYQYETGNSKRFFYAPKGDSTEVQPLIYKRYKIEGTAIGTNNQFRDQLAKQIDCPEISKASIARMEYKEDPLIRLFQEINNCYGGDAETFKMETPAFQFHIAARVGFNHANAYVEQQPDQPFPESRRIIVDFGSKIYPRVGMEFELVLPFRGNRWRVFLDPSYQAYKSEKQFVQRIGLNDVQTTSELTYTTIEVPVGIRHHIILTERSHLFVNASVAAVFNSNSKVDFETPSALGEINDIEIEGTEDYFSLGLGYNYNEQWSIEVRFNTNRDLLASRTHWTSTFDKNFSVILGYRFL